ncbi:MAG: hypothetical protein GY749_34925 [Desulfobacteraceae bacterium]|nr:hypothetical protein [Desulfobacteraceae bacterium]
MKEPPGYMKSYIGKFLELLKGGTDMENSEFELTPEELMENITPEQRLAGLTPAQIKAYLEKIGVTLS